MLRRAAFGGLVVAIGLFAWAQFELWPTERALYLFHTGRVQAASAQLLAVAGEVPPWQQALADELQREVDDTLELGLESAPWDELREELANRAMPRLEAELVADPAGAMRWVSLALYQRDPPDWLRALYYYCRSVSGGDTEEAERTARHILALEQAPPEAILDALAHHAQG